MAWHATLLLTGHQQQLLGVTCTFKLGSCKSDMLLCCSIIFHTQLVGVPNLCPPLHPCTLAAVLLQACIFFICSLPVAELLRPVSVQAGGAASFEPGRPKAASHRLCAHQPQSLRPSGLCQCYAVAQAFWERPSLVSLPPLGIPVIPIAPMQHARHNLWRCVQV